MTDVPVALIDLSVGTLHAAGDRHGVARCGVVMGDPWMAGPQPVVAERARALCPRCFPAWVRQCQ
jgi:hypothetical protein